MAEGLLKRLFADQGVSSVRVHSAGTLGIEGHPASAHGVEACRDGFGVDISRHHSKGVTPAMLEEADLILCMARRHCDRIAEIAPRRLARCHLLKTYAGSTDRDPDLFDPVGSDYLTYRRSCEEIAVLLHQALPRLLEELQAGTD